MNPLLPTTLFDNTYFLQKPQQGLMIVSVPIGNLGDITLRAIQTCKSSDIIFCEDTRVSHALFKNFSISVPLQSYHEHNADKIRPKIIELVHAGKQIALVSDAGTPLISDPGYKLVQEMIRENLPFHIIPGVSSPIVALTGAGLPTDQFSFRGFIPSKPSARRSIFTDLKYAPETLIFFETAQRLKATLEIMQEVFGNRQICVARELTKTYEEFIRGSLSDVYARVLAHATLKGEIVLMIKGVGHHLQTDDHDPILERVLKNLLESYSVKEAVALAVDALKVSKKSAYALALQLHETTAR